MKNLITLLLICFSSTGYAQTGFSALDPGPSPDMVISSTAILNNSNLNMAFRAPAKEENVIPIRGKKIKAATSFAKVYIAHITRFAPKDRINAVVSR